MSMTSKLTRLTIAGAAISLMTACGGGSTVEESGGGDLTQVSAGYVSAIDQIGLPLALENGYFEETGIEMDLAEPFPTGVDALNALQAGEIDIAQVGTPVIAAAQKGDDLVLVGNYTGSSTQASIDETMAVVAKDKAGVSADDLSTLKGKKIGVSIGSINHLYLLGLLEDAGLKASDVEIVNTAPPDMPVALETDGIDVGIIWDPWPMVTTKQVEGASEVMRGGGYIPFVGYQVTTRQFAEENPEVIAQYLTARAGVDQWMRENPAEAATASTRWLPGTEEDVAQEAMKYNVEQLDPRLSACNIFALDTIAGMLAEEDVVEPGFKAADYFQPDTILSVVDEHPELFDDLDKIPEAAVIGDDFTYDRAAAEKACP